MQFNCQMEAPKSSFSNLQFMPFASKNKVLGSNWTLINESVSTNKSSIRGSLFTGMSAKLIQFKLSILTPLQHLGGEAAHTDKENRLKGCE
jgi:hypothetical protein